MEKVLDAIANYLPSPVMGAVLLIAMAFWGVHYWHGFRDYGDTLRDKTFLSLAVVVAAAVCLYLVNRAPSADPSHPPLLLVPFFENDERDQYRTAVASQVEQVLARGGQSRAVYALPVSLAEYQSAVRSAKHYGAVAAIFNPVVIRVKDSVKISFHIAFVVSDASMPYAMLPVELPTATLDEIANTLLAATAGREGPRHRNPLLSRLDTLERQLEGLKVTIDQVAARQRGNEAPYLYRQRHALVVGVDDLPTVGFSLQYAVSDALAFARILTQYDFDTTLLLGNEATKASVLQALDRLRQRVGDEDLALFYYAGPSFADPAREPSQRTLFLVLADSKPDEPASMLTIKDLAKALEVVQARHKLALLDGCDGTTGLLESSTAAGLATGVRPAAPVLQFFSASGNDEKAIESAALGGGAFTQALIRVLGQGAHAGRGLWMHEVVTDTTALVRELSRAIQTPKLVTLSGNGEVFWSPVAERRSP